MEIRVLRYFLAIAREGNITGAANRLHLSQPTLSRQIRDLEEELGKQLFIRGSHSVSLTSEGMLLRKRAEEIVSMVDKTEAEFHSMNETIGGDVYIGGGESRAMKLLADIIKDIQTDYPDIHFHLYSGNAEDVAERLDKGLLDFGVLIQPADIPKYHYVNLPFYDVWGVVMRKDSLLARQSSIMREDLLDIPLIFSRQVMQQPRMENAFADWFGEDYDRVNVVSTFNLFYNAALMVESGVGYAVTLDKLANTSEVSDLCFRPLEPQLESGLSVVWKKYQVFSKAAELFLEKLQTFRQTQQNTGQLYFVLPVLCFLFWE